MQTNSQRREGRGYRKAGFASSHTEIARQRESPCVNVRQPVGHIFVFFKVERYWVEDGASGRGKQSLKELREWNTASTFWAHAIFMTP